MLEVVWNPGQTMVFGVSGDITGQEEWRDRMFLWDRLYWQTKRETLADIIQQVEPPCMVSSGFHPPRWTLSK